MHLYGTELYEPSWKGAKAMMANPNFLSSLMSFDKDSLSDRKIRHVRRSELCLWPVYPLLSLPLSLVVLS